MNNHIMEAHTHIAYQLMKKMLNITTSQEYENIYKIQFPIHQFGWFNLTVLSLENNVGKWEDSCIACGRKNNKTVDSTLLKGPFFFSLG